MRFLAIRKKKLLDAIKPFIDPLKEARGKEAQVTGH